MEFQQAMKNAEDCLKNQQQVVKAKEESLQEVWKVLKHVTRSFNITHIFFKGWLWFPNKS